MTTREEIEQEYVEAVRRDYKIYLEAFDAHKRRRDAALAELDDPMLRLINAAKEWRKSHTTTHFTTNASCKACDDFQSAIDYAEQRRSQG
jgi:hypothetical protein